MSGPIAVVADRTQAAELTDLLGGASSRKLSILAPRPFAPFTRAYTHAALAVVAAPRAMPAAVLASRVFRVPWVAAAPRGVSTRVLFQAAAVLAAPDELDDARRSSQLRVVLRDDEQRLRSLIDDLALSEDARGTGGSMLSRALANGWVFLNDRLTRVAIRLVPVTRKFPEPIHPKHLIDAPWHFWYDTDLQAGDRVLDVGCGSGEHAVHAAARVRSVLGIDVDARRLELAARLAGESGVDNVEFRRGDLTDAETFDLLRREPFDAVLLLDILEHLAHRGELLESVRRLLRPGGRLFVSVPNRNTPYKRWRRRLGGFSYSDDDHKVEYSEQLIRSELEAAGFTVVAVRLGGYDTPVPGPNAILGAISLRAYRRLAARRARLAVRHPERSTAFRVIAAPRGRSSAETGSAGTT